MLALNPSCAKATSMVSRQPDAQVFYTDNMLFEADGEKNAGVAVATVEAAFMTPPCITPLASYRAEVGYRHQFFNYFGDDDVASTWQGVGRRRFRFRFLDRVCETRAQTKHYQFGIGFDYTRLLGCEIRGIAMTTTSSIGGSPALVRATKLPRVRQQPGLARVSRQLPLHGEDPESLVFPPGGG